MFICNYILDQILTPKTNSKYAYKKSALCTLLSVVRWNLICKQNKVVYTKSSVCSQICISNACQIDNIRK